MSFLLRLAMYVLVVVGLGLLVLPISNEGQIPGYQENAAVSEIPIRVAGGALLALACLLIYRLYRRRSGEWLNVSATLKAALFDSIGLVVAAVLCAGVPAKIIEETLSVQNPLHGMGDTELAFVAGMIGLLFGAPIMSLMASLLAPSWVKVDAEGVSQKGMILRTQVGWQELKKISVETRTLRGRDRWGNPTDSGSVDFQVLELESEDAVVSLLVPTAKTRAEVVRRLREHVPEWHRENLEAHLREWRW